jgi:outer membrane protein OmpA-like peptidoglycan-associated protein
LKELNNVLAAKNAANVKQAPGGEKLYRDTRRYRRKARVLYQNGDRKRAKHFATLGQLRYRTAEALMRQYRAKQQFETRTEDLSAARRNLREREGRVAELQKDVNDLEEALATDRSDQLAARLSQLPDDPSASLLEDYILRAGKRRKQALSTKANEYAEAHFNRAENHLKSARNLAKREGSIQAGLEAAVQAVHFFEEAEKKARPAYEEQIRKMQPEHRIEQIQKTCLNTFGSEYVKKTSNGVRVVLAGVFSREKSDIKPQSRRLVEALATIATDFSEFSLDIHGYAHGGLGDAEQLELSRLRAEVVKGLLTENDIDESRIATFGEGGSMRRFERGESLNERVEVSLRVETDEGASQRSAVSGSANTPEQS